MHMVAAYEPTSKFDPTNPNQVIADGYRASPMPGYYSTYWNQVPTKAQLLGLGHRRISGVRGLRGFSGWPAWVQALVVGGIAAGAGYGTMRYFRHRR